MSAKRGPNERSIRMAALYRSGKTLQQIGDEFGITRERVRQIITMRHGLRARDGGKSVAMKRTRARRAAARDASCLTEFGCTWSQRQFLLVLGGEAMARGLHRDRTPIGAFRRQRQNAKIRGIGWELTLWQWWTIWQDSGRWEQRGRGQGYVMCRKGDQGPYAADNVFIATAAENSGTSKTKKSRLPLGVKRSRSGRYCADRQINGTRVHLGTFDDPDAAHAAYLAAGQPQQVAA